MRLKDESLLSSNYLSLVSQQGASRYEGTDITALYQISSRNTTTRYRHPKQVTRTNPIRSQHGHAHILPVPVPLRKQHPRE